MSPDRNGHADAPRRGGADRYVFLGMPGYGDLTAGAARGFWRATRLPDEKVRRQYNAGSLLANNFNSLWCEALNLARSGGRLDYFAMQHSDIEPEDWWLDKLIDELESNSLDVLGVVAPIKDQRGVTSIALDHPSGSPWRKLCRLTMREAYRLPETFTSADLGHPVLLNTGLWVCRFHPIWAATVHFEINDRIVQGTDHRYVPENESEDWQFSRLLHEVGRPGGPTEWLRPLRIGCTRKVRLLHRGDMAFANDRAWGTDEFDRACTPEPVIPEDPCNPGWRFPADVVGWLTRDEGLALARLAKGKRVLEVGSYYGRSTICMAQTAARLVSVDVHDGRATPAPCKTLDGLRANLERFGVADKVTIRVGTLYRDPAWPDEDRFDLVFLDGDHSRDAVERDVACALDRLDADGLIAFHDYDSVHLGVKAAVDDLVASGGELVSLVDSLAVVKPPAAIPLEV